MPVIKRTILGAEYSFAPLKLKELRSIQQARTDQTVFERLDEWKPMIESSLERGKSEMPMPEIEEMDFELAGQIFGELIRGVLAASGLEVKEPGEVKPAEAKELTGADSMASSSPLPAGACMK